MFPMQWDGNLTKGGKYLGVLALLNLWIQLGMLCALSLCNLYYYPFFSFLLSICQLLLQVGHICCRFEFKINEMASVAISEPRHLIFSEVSSPRSRYSWMPGCSHAYGEC